jgi:hypothetical protein
MEFIAADQLPSTAISTPFQADSSVSAAPRDSAALRRLMEEVRCEELTSSSAAMAYNRQHNRHNR